MDRPDLRPGPDAQNRARTRRSVTPYREPSREKRSATPQRIVALVEPEVKPRAHLKPKAEVRPYAQNQPAADIQRPWRDPPPKGKAKGKGDQTQPPPNGKAKGKGDQTQPPKGKGKGTRKPSLWPGVRRFARGK